MDICIHHTKVCAGRTQVGPLQEKMSENGAEVEIQSFLSDGTVFPRDTEMRARRFAHSSRLCTPACTEEKKNTLVTKNQAKPAHIKGRVTSQYQHVSVLLPEPNPPVLVCGGHSKSESQLVYGF